MRTALFSVIHHKSLPYFNDFLKSLENQTDKDFILFLANDGVQNIEETIHRFDLNIKLNNVSGTIAAIRKEGIEWVIVQGADIIVFMDSDDYFSTNRIQILKNILISKNIVFNELMVIGKNVQQPYPMFGHRFKEGAELAKDDILNANCLGLSNTAINTKAITRLLSQIPDDIIAFDWAFYSLCLSEGVRAVFTKQTVTYYRQFDHSIAMLKSFSDENILRVVQVKYYHYRFMSRLYEEYISIYKEFEKLLERLTKDSFLRKAYSDEVKRQSPPLPLWWEAIKTLKELGI